MLNLSPTGSDETINVVQHGEELKESLTARINRAILAGEIDNDGALLMSAADIERLLAKIRPGVSGKRLHVRVFKTRSGGQTSPFGDKIVWGDTDYVIIDPASGKRVDVSDGHPYLIGNYGFYQGNTRYRVGPDQLIEMMSKSDVSGTVK